MNAALVDALIKILENLRQHLKGPKQPAVRK
jgi:hypothetical protein